MCRITPRTLDYWITTKVVRPSRQIVCNRRGRILFLFSFRDLVRIRIVKSYRDAGISLGAIRQAISQLTERHGENWQKAWIVTDGRRLFEATDDPSIIQSLARREKDQLVMSVIAIGEIQTWVRSEMKRKQIVPMDPGRFDGRVEAWRRA